MFGMVVVVLIQGIYVTQVAGLLVFDLNFGINRNVNLVIIFQNQ